MPVWLMLAIIVLLNLPFGYWRAGVRKFSFQWILAIHVPILLAIGIRVLHEIPFEPATVVLTTVALVLGQRMGQQMRAYMATTLPVPLTSCVFIDLLRAVFN